MLHFSTVERADSLRNWLAAIILAKTAAAKAESQSKANRLLQAIEKWNGVLPTVSGGSTPILDLRALKSGD